MNFLFMLGGNSLWDVDEPNNAVCAREMLEAGNWFVPVFNGALRFDKPILLYWLMMPSFSLFGANEFSARLPSALAITGLIFVVWYFGKRLLDAKSGLIAAILLATCIHIVVISRAATPDPLFMLCMAFAFLAFICIYIEKEPGFLLPCFYVAIGFGALAKGPVALLMPGLLIGAYLFLMADFSAWRRFRPLLGMVIILAVALPWYIAVGILTDGEWLRVFFLHHNVDRFTDTLQGHRAIPGLYVLTVLIGCFPWTGLVAASVWSGPWRLNRLRQDPLRLFLLVWVGVFLIFFTAARTHLPNYMLPVFPALTLLCALWLRSVDTVDRDRVWRWTVWIGLILALGLMLGGGIAIEKKWVEDWILVLAVLPVALGAIWWLRHPLTSAIQPLAAGMVASVFLLSFWAAPSFDKHKISPELARQADEAGFSGSELASYRYFQPSLLFYHGGRLPYLGNIEEVIEWLGDRKAIVMPTVVLTDLPETTFDQLVVHSRLNGLYARTELVLVSLQTGENM